MKNALVASILRDISYALEVQGVEFKPKAYARAARTIENLSEDIAEIYGKKGLKGLDEIPNIGESIAKKIEEIKQLIIQNTTNNPEQVKHICEQTRILKEHDEQHQIRQQIKPTNKRINIMDTNTLVSLGYLMITLRYVFYGRKEYEIGYILSTIAYFIFFMFRRRKRKN
jgi:hypothetical protein